MDALARARRRMLTRLDHEFRSTQGVTGRATPSPRVWWALSAVPREAFVEEGERPDGWIDAVMPFGHGNALSRSFLVALTTDLLDLSPDDVVLEVGTGSGYTAALLGALAGAVHTLEVVPAVAERARGRLARLGYGNVEVHERDGAAGLPTRAPFDAILVSGATPAIPRALLEQLRDGGRLVVPVATNSGQELLFVKKAMDGRISWQSVLPVQLPRLQLASGV